MRIFRRIQTADADLMKVQNAVEQILNPLARTPLLDGTALNGLAFTAGNSFTVQIAHTLARQPLGFFVTDINANAVLHRTAWTTTTITLVASAACTCNVWIY